jgi:hypothetical protein
LISDVQPADDHDCVFLAKKRHSAAFSAVVAAQLLEAEPGGGRGSSNLIFMVVFRTGTLLHWESKMVIEVMLLAIDTSFGVFCC